MASTFRCRLITPDAQVLDDAATAAVLPLWDGLMGILPGRAPIVTQLGTGQLRVDFPDKGSAKGGSRSFYVDEGFAQMVDNTLTILAAYAVGAENLNETDAQAEVSSLNNRNTSNMSALDLAQFQKDKARAEGKLRAVRSIKAQGGL